MSQDESGVKEVSQVVTQSESPTDENGNDFYSDIPEPKGEGQPSQETEHQEEVKQSNKGAQERIRELNQAKKEAESQRDSLAAQMEEMNARFQMPQTPPPPDYQGDEITAEELEARVLSKASALAELQYQQRAHAQRVQQEANSVMKEYPQLDPDSGDAYDPDLSSAVTEAALAYIRTNPTASLEKFVKGLMKPYARSVENKVGQLADTVTRQAAETALRPTNTPRGDKRPEDMSLEELEARLGVTY